jgi:hypothetical protein
MEATVNRVNQLLLSYPEAMAALGGIGRTKFFELVASGAVTKVCVGRRVFVTSASVAQYVNRLADEQASA